MQLPHGPRPAPPPYTARQQQLLRAIADTIVPGSTDYAVPGAGDDRIFADLLIIAKTHASALGGLLDRIDRFASEHHRCGFLEIPQDARLSTAEAFRAAYPNDTTLLETLVIQVYYRDDRVMRSLDMEVRPPFPKGFVVEEGDWALLDPVRARPEFYVKIP